MVVRKTDSARAERERQVENAIATGRIEGLEPSDGAKAIFQRYVDGEITSDEMDRKFDEYLDGKYGPVRLPRTDVLRNLRDIRDDDMLAAFEADATARRIRQLEGKALPGKFDIAHLQSIHRHIFQEMKAAPSIW